MGVHDNAVRQCVYVAPLPGFGAGKISCRNKRGGVASDNVDSEARAHFRLKSLHENTGIVRARELRACGIARLPNVDLGLLRLRRSRRTSPTLDLVVPLNKTDTWCETMFTKDVNLACPRTTFPPDRGGKVLCFNRECYLRAFPVLAQSQCKTD